MCNFGLTESSYRLDVLRKLKGGQTDKKGNSLLVIAVVDLCFLAESEFMIERGQTDKKGNSLSVIAVVDLCFFGGKRVYDRKRPD